MAWLVLGPALAPGDRRFRSSTAATLDQLGPTHFSRCSTLHSSSARTRQRAVRTTSPRPGSPGAMPQTARVHQRCTGFALSPAPWTAQKLRPGEHASWMTYGVDTGKVDQAVAELPRATPHERIGRRHRLGPIQVLQSLQHSEPPAPPYGGPSSSISVIFDEASRSTALAKARRLGCERRRGFPANPPEGSGVCPGCSHGIGL